MYLTHTFASRETLSRAHTWLTRLGFHHRHTASGTPRIMLLGNSVQLAAARMLINVAENADPKGFPGLWDQGPHSDTTPEPHHEAGLAESPKPHHSVLGWHPLD